LCVDLKTPTQFSGRQRLSDLDKALKRRKISYTNQTNTTMSHFNDKTFFKPRRLSGKGQKKLSLFADIHTVFFLNRV